MRVSLARSLTLEPELFLFDEPFGALGAISRERLNDELLGLYLSKGFTALFVTHSVTEAVFMSSRVVVISARLGRVLSSSPVPFGFPRPAGLRFAAPFAQLARKVSACPTRGRWDPVSVDEVTGPMAATAWAMTG